MPYSVDRSTVTSSVEKDPVPKLPSVAWLVDRSLLLRLTVDPAVAFLD